MPITAFLIEGDGILPSEDETRASRMTKPPDKATGEGLDLLPGVEELVRRVAKDADLEDDGLAEALIGLGLSRDDAERVLAFAPLAFGRQLLSSDPPKFAKEYEIRDLDSGRSVRGMIDEEPAYLAALEYLRRHAEDTSWIRAGERSAEIDAARQLTAGGGSLQNFVFTEPVMLRIPLPSTGPRQSWWHRLRGAR